MEKMLLNMADLHLILYITVKGGGLRGNMKFTGDGLGRWEKAKWRNLWDWINRHFYISGYRTASN